MATINATITLSSADLTSDALSISSTSTLSEAGVNTGLSQTDGLTRRTYSAAGANTILTAATYTEDEAHKVYIKNLSTTASESVLVKIGGVEIGYLYAQDWLFIPWSADTAPTPDADISITTSATNMTVEWMVFVQTYA